MTETPKGALECRSRYPIDARSVALSSWLGSEVMIELSRTKPQVRDSSEANNQIDDTDQGRLR